MTERRSPASRDAGTSRERRPAPEIREATPADAAAVARLLHDFNQEYDDFTPGVEALTERLAAMLESSEITALLAGEGPDGFALLRFWPSYLVNALEAYIAELYVVPHLRRQGIGRLLLRTALDESRDRGAEFVFLGTSEDDKAALALYESEGFTNREGGLEGPLMLFYEREL
jgi:ribosomal protein S18 acetylase RimI-like enzyme